MDPTKEKESFKKLVKFTVVITLLFLVFLQIATLIYLYSIKEKAVSNGLSKEHAPIPALTMCVKTDELAREEILDKYNIQSLLLDQDPEKSFVEYMTVFIKAYWKHFDWGSVSLKQLYNEAVIYPQELVKRCEVGDDYNCTETEGTYHLWENVLKRSYSCSTLRIWKKVAFEKATMVFIRFEGLVNIPLHYQVHDTRKSAPRYTIKPLDHERYIENDPHESGKTTQTSFTYTVEKEEQLSENGQSCSEDPDNDRLKCEEDCFEKQLLQDNSSCILPWVMSPGRQCSNIDEAIAMVKKEKELVKIQCDCQDSCTLLRYVPNEGDGYVTEDCEVKAVIDNRSGIALVEESYMFTFLDLLANCGGSLGVFFSVSCAWLITEIITIVCRVQYCFQFVSSNRIDNFVRYLVTASSLACLSLFMYEASHFIMKYLQNPTMVTIDRLSPLLSPIPNVLICNKELIYHDIYYLEENYIETMYTLPAHHMTECRLDNETCMTDGASFSWEKLYSMGSACSMLRFNSNQGHKKLEITFDNEFIEFNIFMVSWNIIPRYDVDMHGSILAVKPHMIASAAYNSEQRFNLPPCTNSFLECRHYCWEQLYLKEDFCSPPEMPPNVRHQPCKTMREFIDLFSYHVSSREHTATCQCDEQCSDFIIQASTSQELYDDVQSKLSISLVPLSFIKTSEEWAYPFNNLIAEIGGMLGVLTGMSFSSMLVDLFVKVISMQRKRSSKSSITKSFGEMVISLTFWAWFLQQAYVSISRYMEAPVQMNKEIDKQSSLIQLPDFVVCDFAPMITMYAGEIFAYSAYGYEPLFYYSMDHIDWTGSWFNLKYFMKDCIIFGIPCNDQKGEIHEWHTVSNVNRFCLRLEIKPLKLQDYRDNRVVFTMLRYIRYFVSNKGENRLVHLQAMDGIGEIDIFKKRSLHLHLSRYELLEEKPNNCINQVGYNKRNCLDRCVIDHVLETLNCRFPWMELQTPRRICTEYFEYKYLAHINSTFLASCQCLPECQYTQNDLVRVSEQSLRNPICMTEISIIPSKTAFKESWSYTAPQLLATLGGLMNLFTGLTLYDAFFSGSSYFLDTWELVRQGFFFNFRGGTN